MLVQGKVQHEARGVDRRKTVLISGASSGIGRAAAVLLTREGYRVIATVRATSDPGLTELGVHVVTMELDCTKSVSQALFEVLNMLDGQALAAYFANAGYGLPVACRDLTRAMLLEQFQSNLFGHVELINGLLDRKALCAGSKIVFNSSVLAYSYLPMRSAYCASKAAMWNLANVMRLELSDARIPVVLIEPGPIASEFRANALRALQRHVALCRLQEDGAYRATVQRLGQAGPVSAGTLSCDDVARLLLKILKTARPAARYKVTKNAKIMAILTRLLPTSALDWVIRRIGRLEVKLR